MRIDSDIDIDVGDRDSVLSFIRHIHASMRNVNPVRRHPSGFYITDIPYDPVMDMAAIDYAEAEARGYFKIDLLNVFVYSLVKDEAHLERLMQEPDWAMLNDRKIVEQLIHLGNHYNSIQKMPEPINSIPRLAMFLASIRPSKKHLIGKTWKEISKTIWDKDIAGYQFKKSHAIAYAQLVVVHLNLLRENAR